MLLKGGLPTRTEKVIERLRDLILELRFEPEARLQEETLAGELGVSRTPVRAALAILASEGLLVYSPNRGYQVRPFTIDDIFDAYDTRSTLEGMACRVAAERTPSPQEAETLAECLEGMQQILEAKPWRQGDLDEWYRLNQRFHATIHHATRNQYLIRAIALVHRVPLIYHPLHGSRSKEPLRRYFSREQAREAHKAHTRIYQTIVEGQGTRAESLMREHIYSNRETFLVKLAQAFADHQLGAASTGISPPRRLAGARAQEI